MLAVYLRHQPFCDVRADEACSSADANFDDPIGANFLGMLSFEVTDESVSHSARLLFVSSALKMYNKRRVRKIYYVVSSRCLVLSEQSISEDRSFKFSHRIHPRFVVLFSFSLVAPHSKQRASVWRVAFRFLFFLIAIQEDPRSQL